MEWNGTRAGKQHSTPTPTPRQAKARAKAHRERRAGGRPPARPRPGTAARTPHRTAPHRRRQRLRVGVTIDVRSCFVVMDRGGCDHDHRIQQHREKE